MLLVAPSEAEVKVVLSPGDGVGDCGGEDGGGGDEGMFSRYPRVELSCEPRHQRFLVRTKTFSQQFSHVYNKRLVALKGPVRRAAEQRWRSDFKGQGGAGTDGERLQIVDRLVNMRQGDRWVIIGTTYKAMKLRPSILNEFREDRGISMSVVVPFGSFTSEDDSLMLEDESGRVALAGPGIPCASMVSGMVIAVKGTVKESGEFWVEDWCPAGIPAPEGPLGSPKAEESSGCVLLVSGLQVGGQHDPLLVSLLADFVAGYLGDEDDQQGTSARIGRVIVCGDSVSPPSAEMLSGTGASKRLNAEQQRLIASPMKELDTMLALLAAAAPVDVMPGESDPANFTLPQQPLHPCLLKNSSRFSSLKRVTNPYEAVIGSRLVLGSSGQPLHDMAKYTVFDSQGKEEGDGEKPACLRRLEDTLRWRHLAPTAPETLGCYPFVTDDPFVIEECPDVYFAGNQPTFATSVLEGDGGHKVRLVCVPAFARTGEAVLVRLVSLDCTPVRFASDVGPPGSWGVVKSEAEGAGEADRVGMDVEGPAD